MRPGFYKYARTLIKLMKIVLLQIGKTTEKYITDGVDKYSDRICKYSGFEIITMPDLKNSKNMPVTEQKLKQDTKICKVLNDDDYVVLLDENGKEFSTKEFSEQLAKIFMLSKKRVVFIIGGPFGFSGKLITGQT